MRPYLSGKGSIQPLLMQQFALTVFAQNRESTMAADIDAELKKARDDYEKAKQQIKALYDKKRARITAAKRREDTRRKIILGGALIELAARNPDAADMIATLVEGLSREQDRKAFDGWERPGKA